jgi:Tfp pilus assembly protein PilF
MRTSIQRICNQKLGKSIRGWQKQLYPFLQDHALIFVGYGGNDGSILKFVQECPIPALAPPIYWVSRREPPLPFAKWLHQRNALRADHTDFDQLMHLIRGALNIELLDRTRWTQIGDTYYEAFERLREQIDTTQASAEDTVALQAATSEAVKSLPDDWSYFQHARSQMPDKNQAEITYREGLEKFPESPVLNGNFAVLLEDLGKFDEAEGCYKKAIQIDPTRQITITNYAIFLEQVRKNLDGAEELHKRAIEAASQPSYSLSRYAVFLNGARNDPDSAEVMFKRSIEAEDKRSSTFVAFAQFKSDQRNDLDAAEALYRRAIEVEPGKASNHRALAFFLEYKRQRLDEAEESYKNAVAIQPYDTLALVFYGQFLQIYRMNPDGAESLYKQALENDPNHEYTLSVYSKFLESVRENPSAAAQYIERLTAIKQKTK